MHTLDPLVLSTKDISPPDPATVDTRVPVGTDDAGVAGLPDQLMTLWTRPARPALRRGHTAEPGRRVGRKVLVTVSVGLGAAGLAVMGAALGRMLAGTVLARLSLRHRRSGGPVSGQ